MTRLLPLVLSPDDLPQTELAAARLDGEVYAVGAGFAPVDEVEQPTHRARSLGSGIHDRLIAEQLTAAWVWGAVDAMPVRRQFCAAIGARVTRASTPWNTIREVIIEPREIAAFENVHITTPLRTCVDLARFSAEFEELEANAVVRLLAIAGLTLADCADEINRRRNLPNKRQALERLQRVQREQLANRLAADRLEAAR